MRVSPVVTVAAFALASCFGAGCTSPPPAPSPTPTPIPTPTPEPTPRAKDLTIGIHLYRQPDPPKKCVVSFNVPDLKEAKNAVAYTGYQVIWQITKNDCGDLKKGSLKALGLKTLDKPKGHQARWFKYRCTTLSFVPGEFVTPPDIRCFIPPYETDPKDILGQYEYGIDGDDVEPSDPDLDVKRGG